MFLQVQYLSGIELHVILDNVVMGDIVTPAFSADFVGWVERELRCRVARGVGWCVVKVRGEGIRREGIENLGGCGWVVEVDVVE